MATSKHWTTEAPGVRYYEHPTRYHGKRPDRYYTLRYTIAGKQTQEGLGWTSQGWTLRKAQTMLIHLKEAQKTGIGAPTLQEAREQAIKAKQDEIARQEELHARNRTLDDFWKNEYLPNQIDKKPYTIRKEKDLYAHWLRPTLGNMPLVEISDLQLNIVKQVMMDAGKAPRTIQYALGIFSQVWHLAERRGLVSGIAPTRLVKAPRFDNQRVRFLTQDEATRLLNELKKVSDDLYLTALLSLSCGLRAGEIHALTWGNIDLENKQLIILDPKNGHTRYAHITNPKLEKSLREKFHFQAPTELLLPSRNGGPRTQVSQAFGKAVERLGFNRRITDKRQKVVFHTLRHTFASWLVQKGVPLYVVSKMMGHTNLEMTQRYSHLAPNNTLAAAQELATILKDI